MRSNADLERTIGEVDVHTLVKEVGQNSLDAVVDLDNPVILEFSIIFVKASEKTDILNLLGLGKVDDILKNLKIMSETDKNEKNRYLRMIERFEENEDFYLLVISDYNTTGLIGDDKLSLKKPSRFQGFNYKLGISQKESNRGSFGEGRMAALATSDIQFVFQISHLSEKWQSKNYRVFGLGIHGLFEDDQEKIGSGAFFSCTLENGEVRSLMLDDLKGFNGLINPLRLKEFGTSFVFPFFNPKRLVDHNEDDSKELIVDQIKVEILKHSEESFFPSISNGNLKILVNSYTYGNYNDINQSVLDNNNLDKMLDFISNLSTETNIPDDLPIVEDFYLDEVLITIPQGGRPRLNLQLPIKLIKFKDTYELTELPISIQKSVNRIIFARNGMVIQSYNCRVPPKFYYIGLLNVNHEEHKDAHDLLRLSEPVRHDEWKNTATRLKDSYGVSSGPDAMRKFKKEMYKIVKKYFGYSIDESTNASENTRRMLFSGIGKSNPSAEISTVAPKENTQINIERPGNKTGGTVITKKPGKGRSPNVTKTGSTGTSVGKTPRKPRVKNNVSLRKKTPTDIIALQFSNTIRSKDKLTTDLILPGDISNLSELIISTKIITHEEIFDFNLSYEIRDVNGIKIKSSEKIDRNQFPIKLEVKTDQLPERLAKNVNLAVYVGGVVDE